MCARAFTVQGRSNRLKRSENSGRPPLTPGSILTRPRAAEKQAPDIRECSVKRGENETLPPLAEGHDARAIIARMAKSEAPHVMIVARRDEDARRWADLLGEVANVASAEGAPGSPIEVLITDKPLKDALASAGFRRAGRGHRPAVLGIGDVEGADTVLAADFSSRELMLACQLLGEIERLRVACAVATRTHEEAMQLAETDPLTGLANRRAWDRRLAAAIARGREQIVWLAVVDLDRFKQINDERGYAAGDGTLVRAAHAMAKQLRHGDLLARLGGDEFGVLVEHMSANHAAAVFMRLRGAVAACNEVTASIGYASSAAHRTASDLSSSAERALRSAKRLGGNQICAAESDTLGGSPYDVAG
jgi:diguanylate cyclase (GGDEF)-like protein